MTWGERVCESKHHSWMSNEIKYSFCWLNESIISKRTKILLSSFFANLNKKRRYFFKIKFLMTIKSWKPFGRYNLLNSNWTHHQRSDNELTIKIQVELKHLTEIVWISVSIPIIYVVPQHNNNLLFYFLLVIFVNWTRKIQIFVVLLILLLSIREVVLVLCGFGGSRCCRHRFVCQWHKI